MSELRRQVAASVLALAESEEGLAKDQTSVDVFPAEDPALGDDARSSVTTEDAKNILKAPAEPNTGWSGE